MSTFSFVEAEHDTLAFWQQQQVFQRSLAKNQDKPSYSFYDGPPFATGLPHHGHLVGSILKDIIPRFFTMQGYHVPRRFGWDCHGLPIEFEIDKSLGMNSQQAVAKIGLKAYNDECRNIVQRFTGQWRETITRLGRWVDFDNDYRTMEPWYMESVWWVFKQLWDKGLIYQGHKVMPVSTALGTVLSNFEAGSNYQDTQDPALTVKFKLSNSDSYLLAWTTTPWTLPANQALCVNPNADYVKVKLENDDDDASYIVALSCAKDVFKKQNYEIVEQLKGNDLAGLSYQPLLPYYASLDEQNCFTVMADDYVTTDNGTGIVHMAPAFGEDDYRVCQSNGVKFLACPIDMYGNFNQDCSDLTGLQVKQADKQIILNLKQNNALFHHGVIEHSYPFCPMSDTPIIYRVVPSWYVEVSSFRDELVSNNQQINWVPGHLQQGRMGNWLANANDWAVSRNRYWGTPLPIWKNTTSGKTLCIGSIAELEQYSGIKVDDLHREYVDDIVFSLSDEDGEYQRVPEVLDCWFESGAMPYAQQHYPFENKATFEQSFPADFIAEGLDQTRGWFYTLSVLSQALFGKPAFKNVIVNGIVTAQDGKKMSKRLRNYTAPDKLMEDYGADALRLYLVNSGLVRAEEQRFSNDGVKDMVRRVLLPWYNSLQFLTTYADLENWQHHPLEQASDNLLDQWILSRLQTLTAQTIDHMQNYKIYQVVPQLFSFIDDLTNTYIRLNRARFWQTQASDDKQQAFSCLYLCLTQLSLLMAPFTPFFSEYAFQRLQGYKETPNQTDNSVHLQSYPKVDTSAQNPELEVAVGLMQKVLQLTFKQRQKIKVPVKTPLSKLTIITQQAAIMAGLVETVKSECNIKQLVLESDEQAYFSYQALPNSPVLGKRLGKDFKAIRGQITQLSHQQIQQFQHQGGMQLGDITLGPDDLLISTKALNGLDLVCLDEVAIQLDGEVTEELQLEGWAREWVSAIQQLRKQHGLAVDDRIKLQWQGGEIFQQIVKQHGDHLCAETLCTQLTRAAVQPGDAVSTLELGAGECQISLQRA